MLCMMMFYILFFSGRIECFHLETGEWSTVERYPQDIWEHSVALLYIPRNRDDMDVIPDYPDGPKS